MSTQRTIAELQSALADNVTGDIDAEDIRDVLESLRNGHGEISITGVLETTMNTIEVFEPIAGTYALSGNAHNWDMNTNGQLRYLGPEARVAHIAVSISFHGSNQKIYHIRVAKNGTPIAPSEVQRKIGVGGDVGSTALHAFIDVDTNDYLSVEVANFSGTEACTFETLNLFVMDMVS